MHRFIIFVKILIRTALILVFLLAGWLTYQAIFSTNESFSEMVDRAELWCEKNYEPRPAPTGGKPELTEFDDCVDAEIRPYVGSAFFPPIGGILGGFILLLYFVYWGVRFAWRQYRRHKRMRQNPYI